MTHNGTTREEMLKYMEEASRIVASWPEWKRNILGRTESMSEKSDKDFLTRLRQQNRSRSNRWTGGADGPEFKAIEFGGECGELLNAIKKRIRFLNGWKAGVDNRENLEDEFGDVLICLDRLADAFEVDLTAVAAAKFNKTSTNYGFPERL